MAEIPMLAQICMGRRVNSITSIFAGLITTATVLTSSTLVRAEVATFDYNESVGKFYIGTVRFETGNFDFRGQCTGYDLGSCTSWAKVTKYGTQFSVDVTPPTCNSVSRLRGSVTLEWTDNNGSTFRQTDNFHSGDEGLPRTMYRFFHNANSLARTVKVSTSSRCISVFL